MCELESYWDFPQIIPLYALLRPLHKMKFTSPVGRKNWLNGTPWQSPQRCLLQLHCPYWVPLTPTKHLAWKENISRNTMFRLAFDEWSWGKALIRRESRQPLGSLPVLFYASGLHPFYAPRKQFYSRDSFFCYESSERTITSHRHNVSASF